MKWRKLGKGKEKQEWPCFKEFKGNTFSFKIRIITKETVQLITNLID